MSIWRISPVLSWLLISLPRFYSDDGICQRMENYTVTSMETYNEPVVVNTFTWCLQIPPRCPKTRTEMRKRYRVKTETKQKSVEKCCDGYREESTSRENNGSIICVPSCRQCQGRCVSPNVCQCGSGFHGDDCASICPEGTWDVQCKKKCDCRQNATCEASTGRCICPAGYSGEKCNETCREGRYGKECLLSCSCPGSTKTCHPVTGACNTEDVSIEQIPSGHSEYAIEEGYEDFAIVGHTDESIRDSDITEFTTPGCVFPCRNNEASDECDPESDGCTSNDVSLEQIASTYPRSTTEVNYETWKVAGTKEGRRVSSMVSETTEHAVEGSNLGEAFVVKDYPSPTTEAAMTPTPTMNYLQIRTQTQEEVPSSTAGPVIVLVSVPERRRNLDVDRLEFMANNPLLRHANENEQHHDRTPPKTDYVKTAHKEDGQASVIPLDVALIAVASIVSLGLISIAVVMVLQMRSKLFETVRLSIYDEEKSKVQDRRGSSTGRISTIVPGGLQQPQARLSPMFASAPESSAILTVDGIEPLAGYANGAATIGLRISGNFRDLLQDGHYDRPPATLIRLHGNDFDGNGEHLYDEIPLQSTPSCTRKNS